jgi:hypothetical protein
VSSRRSVPTLVAIIAVAAVIAAVAQSWYLYVPSVDFGALGIPTGDFSFAVVTGDDSTPALHTWVVVFLKVLLIGSTGAVMLGARARSGRWVSLAGAITAVFIAAGVSAYVLATPSLWGVGLTCLWAAAIALALLAASSRLLRDGANRP